MVAIRKPTAISSYCATGNSNLTVVGGVTTDTNLQMSLSGSEPNRATVFIREITLDQMIFRCRAFALTGGTQTFTWSIDPSALLITVTGVAIFTNEDTVIQIVAQGGVRYKADATASTGGSANLTAGGVRIRGF